MLTSTDKLNAYLKIFLLFIVQINVHVADYGVILVSCFVLKYFSYILCYFFLVIQTRKEPYFPSSTILTISRYFWEILSSKIFINHFTQFHDISNVRFSYRVIERAALLLWRHYYQRYFYKKLLYICREFVSKLILFKVSKVRFNNRNSTILYRGSNNHMRNRIPRKKCKASQNLRY